MNCFSLLRLKCLLELRDAKASSTQDLLLRKAEMPVMTAASTVNFPVGIRWRKTTATQVILSRVHFSCGQLAVHLLWLTPASGNGSKEVFFYMQCWTFIKKTCDRWLCSNSCKIYLSLLKSKHLLKVFLHKRVCFYDFIFPLDLPESILTSLLLAPLPVLLCICSLGWLWIGVLLYQPPRR